MPGWPAGRKPREVISQGTCAHGYVRRSWKPTDNDGSWMDFQAGWRKTGAADLIRIKLDDDSELDLAYTVDHAIPAPGVGGVTRTLDQLGGADFTAWTSAIAGLSDNDVLVVRARTGGEVYPIDLNAGGATGTASGVKVVAHPDDLAAGRRPRIHVQATKFARYADELNAGHWVVDTDLGWPHGKVWRSVQDVGNVVNVGCSYRTQGGGLKRCHTYLDTEGTPGALARLRDKLYPRLQAHDPQNPSDWSLYMGPGIYLNPANGHLYIRLSPLRTVGGTVVGAKQTDGGSLGPNPPWDWSDDDPENEDPNLCQLFISSSNDQQSSSGPPTTNINYILRINSTNDWTIENLDFVSGGNTIEMNGASPSSPSSGHIVRGCRVLGWAPPNMERNSSLTDSFGNNLDDPNSSTVERVHNMLEAENTYDIICDRCEFWGGGAPWIGWDENKGRHGAYPIPHKANLWWMQGATSGNVLTNSIRFINCLVDGFPTPTRPGGKAVYIKFHQCALLYWGMDGSLICEPPSESIEYIRTQIFEGTFTGMKSAPALDGNLYVGYCLINNFRPFMHENGYWDLNIPQGNQFVCASPDVGHESNYRACERTFLYNNTAIGAHNHRKGQTSKDTGGSLTFVAANGSGAGLHPWVWNRSQLEWMSRNNILAVRPNGSLGDSAGTTGGPSGDSHVGLVLHADHIGYAVGGATYSCDYNVYHRGAGMPTVGSSGVVTTVNAGGIETARNSITDVRNDTGQENNGSIADPLFVGSWDAGKLDSELHANAFWCLQSGSPAASGGDTTNRTWPDMDFGTAVNYEGNSWRGCMDPDATAVEQQVGPLGPMPSAL